MIIDFNKYNGGGSGSGVTPEQVQEQINSALTPYWDSAVTVDYVDGAVSGIDLSNYYTKAETDSAITAVEDHLFDVEEVTASALTELHEDVLELSARTVDLSGYYTSGETDAAISAATAGKADAQNVQSPGQNTWLPSWNTQGVITGTAARIYSSKFSVNDKTNREIINFNGASIPSFYAPVSAGTAGEILVSTGNGAPVWSAITMGGDSTVLKGVSEFPEDAEVGDMVSKVIPIDGFYWDNTDNITDKMHIVLGVLDTEEEYQIATFTAADGPAEVYLGYDSDEDAWMLRVNVDGDDVETLYLTGITDCNIPLAANRAAVSYYAGIGYLPDDYSGQGGMMIQIGLTNGSFGDWEGNVTDIRDYTDYDIPFAETKYVAAGPYYFGGEDWVNIKEEAEKATEDKLVGAFPRMPHFNLDNGGTDIEQVKSAIFDTYDNGGEIINCSEMWLLNTAFDWLDNNVDWRDAGVPIQFTIDPDEKVAYIENIPAGNYIFGLHREQAGDKYDPEFNILYWSKSAADGLGGDWDWQTIENTCDPWDNPDMEMNRYWGDKFDCSIAITNQMGWFNWSFPKDVKRFEIRISEVQGVGDEYLEINTEYKEDVTTADDFGYGIVNKIVKLDQNQYDQLVLDDEVDPDTFYIIVPPNY